MKRTLALGTAAIAAALVLSNCGSDDVAGTIGGLATAVPSFAITSPAVSNSARAAGARSASAMAAEGDPKPMDEAKAELKSILDVTDIKQCFAGMKMTAYSKSVSCYGPMLAYSNHPNGADAPIGGCVAGAGGCLPGGDLGLWSAAEAGGEACSAAQMNALVGDVGAVVNNGLKAMYGLVCVAKIKGKSLPASGETLDLATDVAEAIDGMTTAKLTHAGTHSSGNPLYTAQIAGTVGGKVMSITLVHSPNGDNSIFAGRIYGYASHDGTNIKGFSVVYSQSADKTLAYEARSGTVPAAAASSMFDTSGNFSFANFVAASGAGNARYLLASVDSSTGLGRLKFAWQAGANDRATRVLHVETTAASGGDTGTGYFGFGPKVTEATLGDIDGMVCNWAGPGNVGSGYNLDDKAQKQTMTRNASGIFEPATNNITYAPTNNCNSAAGTFKYSLSNATDWAAAANAVVTNNLADISGGTIAAITAPTF